MKSKLSKLSLITAVLLTFSGQSGANNYTFQDLGTLGGNVSVARSINSSGQVAGVSFTSVPDQLHATTWSNGLVTDLSFGFSGSSQSYGINNSGQVVGYVNGIAAIWTNGSYKNLGAVGGNYSIAWDINNSGKIVGYGTTAGNTSQQALLWNVSSSGTTTTVLGSLGGGYSEAWAINDSGHVAGYSYNAENQGRATVWKNGSIFDLGGGFSSDAQDINNAGQVAGYASSPNSGNYQATLWNVTDTGFEAIDIGSMSGVSESLALGLNNVGQVVGGAHFANGVGRHAALWNTSGGSVTAIDLNNFLSASEKDAGWTLTYANDINDNGWITGEMYNSLTGATHGYLLSLTPVPEPETYAMFLAGLGLIGAVARCQKTA